MKFSASLGALVLRVAGRLIAPADRRRACLHLAGLEALEPPPRLGNRTSQSPAQKNQCMISDFSKNFAWRMPLILRNRTNRPAPIRIIRISDAEFGLQQRIDG